MGLDGAPSVRESMIKAPDVTLLYVIVSFLIAYAILRKWLFGPLGAILDQREEEERAAARIHAESVAELQKTIVHIEQELSAARREALRERETLRAQGRGELDKRLETARSAAKKTLDQARAEIDRDAERSSRELPGRAAGLARLLAEKILGRKLAA
jgi:F-type H+-transporting ATPase subunit b